MTADPSTLFMNFEHAKSDRARRDKEVTGSDYDFLRSKTRPPLNGVNTVRVADLFCGCGGMSLGIREACRRLGRGFEVALAVDADGPAARCFADNFGIGVRQCDIGEMFSHDLTAPATRRERELVDRTGAVDVLVGGPPCQGHSDLNNFSRRNDPKNALYRYMARAAEILSPEHVVIENVLGARHDRGGVVEEVADHLRRLGYGVSKGLVACTAIGIPQTRRRLLMVASKTRDVDLDGLLAEYEVAPRDLRWAIGDLEDESPSTPFTTPSTPSADNRKRIDYLFENALYELPNAARPPCHRDKAHTYRSVYGRLRWDRPAPTITSGFYSTCMGRYVHPSLRRTLTAHEAARLQFFPDSFDFSSVSKRSHLAQIIGNAVPMKLSYVVAMELLAPE